MADLTEKQMVDAWLGDQKEKLLHLAVEEYCVRYSKLAVDIDWYREAQKAIESSASWQKEEARLHEIIDQMLEARRHDKPFGVSYLLHRMAESHVNENGMVCDCCECAPCICDDGDDRGGR